MTNIAVYQFVSNYIFILSWISFSSKKSSPPFDFPRIKCKEQGWISSKIFWRILQFINLSRIILLLYLEFHFFPKPSLLRNRRLRLIFQELNARNKDGLIVKYSDEYCSLSICFEFYFFLNFISFQNYPF